MSALGPFGMDWPPDDRLEVLEGDCVERMRELPEASIDAVVTDPPYGLEFMGKAWDRLGDVRQVTDPTFHPSDASTPFGKVRHGGTPAYSSSGARSGQAQQAWHHAWAVEAFRVLKPGGHLVAFGGTRTYHRLAAALEDAGFEIRDSLAWMFGSGFPKSLDVSKAIDKAAGAERESDTYTGANQLNKVYGENMGGGVTIERGTPATPEAAAWQGWGTSLKPAYEPVVLARKPFNNSVAGNVLEHGTGALNIDACRIATVGETPSADRRDTSRRTGTTPGNPGAKDGTHPFTDRITAERYTEDRPGEQLGRWPANVALSHHPDCVLVGTREVANHGHGPAARGSGGISTSGHAGQDGLTERRVPRETVEEWDCAPDCPVRMLDTQAGSTGGGYGVSAGDPEGHGIYSGGFPRGDMREVGYGDAGGPSRFFQTTPGRWPANVALGHHDACEYVGTRRVKGHQGYPNGPQGNTFTVAGDPDGSRTESVTGHADADGMETVEEWACHPDCPVRMLNEQSGETTSHEGGSRGDGPGRLRQRAGSWQAVDMPRSGHADAGGASRFFYTAKASRSERNAGLEDLPEVANPSYQPRTKRCTICGSTSVNGKAHDTGAPTMNCGHPDSAVELVDPQRLPTAANHHPTVKPVELMRWLVRLVTPPGGRVLDPFLGSGTTGIAASLEGFRFVGIERDADYVEIARRRIAYWAEHGEEALDVVRRREAAERERQAVTDAGQLDLFGGET